MSNPATKQAVTSENWADCKWEIFQSKDGKWWWRASAPCWYISEGRWNWNNNSQNWKNDWSKDPKALSWDWMEMARSHQGWNTKEECQKNAREWGWWV